MSILETLEHFGARIVAFKLTDDKKMIKITEQCDEWFNIKLDKAEFAEMIDELKELHDQMEPKP